MEPPGSATGIHVSPSDGQSHSDISGGFKHGATDPLNTESGFFLHDGTYIDPTVLIQYTDPHTASKVNIGDTLTQAELLVSEPSTILMQEIPGMDHDDGYSEKTHFPFYTTAEHVMPGGGFYPHGYFSSTGFSTMLTGAATAPNGQLAPGADWHYSSLEAGLSPTGHDPENNNNPANVSGVLEHQKQNCSSLSSPSEKGQLPPIQGSILAIEGTVPGATTADISLVNQMQAYVSG